jgi:hypothetical protein
MPLSDGNGNGTYPYDGGPLSPIPMPNPYEPQRGVVPIDGRLVSTTVTGSTSQFGAPPASAAPAKTQSAPRVSYPAYGEEPIPPAPRKTSR